MGLVRGQKGLKMSIVVYVHGGMVIEVRADSPDVSVEVVDFDNADAAAEGWGEPDPESEKPPYVVW